MDHGKLDAALMAALDAIAWDGGEGESLSLPVFVEVDADASEEERAVLTAMGVPPAATGHRLVTAHLSPRQIEELSDAPWVRQLRLSSRLRLLNDR